MKVKVIVKQNSEVINSMIGDNSAAAELWVSQNYPNSEVEYSNYNEEQEKTQNLSAALLQVRG
jgi:hypothetical protein